MCVCVGIVSKVVAVVVEVAFSVVEVAVGRGRRVCLSVCVVMMQ